MVLSRRLHPVQPQIIVAGCHVAQATSLKYLENSWACSTNIFTLLVGKPCPGCTKSTVLPLLPMCGPPSHYLYQQTQDYTEICSKVRHGPLVPRLSGPHPNYELASSCLLHAEKGKSCCCTNIFCLVQSYHPQYWLLTPTLLPSSISVWHCIVLSQKHLPIFTPSSQVLSHYRTSCHLTSSLLTHKLC